jgi:hypothetical protein
MPFAEPERALAATIDIVRKENVTHEKTGAHWNFLQPREFNHFHEDSMT